MLDGLEVTVLKFSEMDLGSRIDAEYFSKENLTVQNALKQKQSKRFAEYGKFVSSAFYPAATHLYEIGVVPFIRCVDCVNYPVISKLQDESFERIPLEFLEEHDSVHKLEKGEIVITKVGTPCYASIVHEHDFVALSRTVFGVKDIKGIDPYYLVAFLRSHYGFQQLQREREQTIQFQLTLDRVRDILVFEPSKDFQKKVGQTLKSSFAQLEQSKRLYAEAEETLLEELGLKNWRLPKESISVKSFGESFGKSGRLDAEHYHPKYDAALKAVLSLKPLEMLPLGEMVTEITNGHTPYGHDLSTGEVPFITAEFVSDFKINFESDKFITQKHHQGELEKTALKDNDLLITIKGKVGNAAVVNHLPREMNINQDVGLMRLNEKYHPYYVAAFLNSILGKELTEQASTGQINPFLGLGNLKFVPIPIFETKQMNKLGEKIKLQLEKAYNAEQESKRLLEMSKQAVEVAIERGESEGMKVVENIVSGEVI